MCVLKLNPTYIDSHQYSYQELVNLCTSFGNTTNHTQTPHISPATQANTKTYSHMSFSTNTMSLAGAQNVTAFRCVLHGGCSLNDFASCIQPSCVNMCAQLCVIFFYFGHHGLYLSAVAEALALVRVHN